jgi:hypothetical protein
MRKNFIDSYPMISNGDISTPITTIPTNVLKLDKASLHVYWSDNDAVGELRIEARIGDKNPWFEIDFDEPLEIKADYNGEFQVLFNELPFTDIRLVYTPTSGTGLLNAILTSKTVGA